MSLFVPTSCPLASFAPLDVEVASSMNASQNKPNNLQMRNVYISGLPATMRASEFREMCQTYGRVEASKLCVDNNCQPTKGYGFALFYNEASARECIRHLNGQVMGGRSMQARLCDMAATPAPLDPGSAHPPISRDRINPKGRQHSALGSSIQSEGPFVVTKSLNMSFSPSSQDVTPTMTPPQMNLSPAMVSTIAGQQPLVYPTQLEQSMGYSAPAAFPAQQGYAPVSTQLMSSQVMGVPFFFTVPPPPPPQSSNSSAQQGAPQQYVYPAVVPPTGYPQQLFSQVAFPSP